tara:strand:- start:24 stop:272 length:249 start_codon:yes stop_codon:yes gene_type:complete
MKIKKLYSHPLSLYEIDLLHYTSTGSDKEYFADALILKAVDSNGISIFSASKKMDLLNLPRETLEKMYLEMFTNEIIRETLH